VAQTRLRRGTDLGCGVAQTRIRRGSDKGASWLRQGLHGGAQTVARRLAVRQARVRISARHPRGGPLPSGSHEEKKRVLDEYTSMSAQLM
jgi:hypothetical protein